MGGHFSCQQLWKFHSLRNPNVASWVHHSPSEGWDGEQGFPRHSRGVDIACCKTRIQLSAMASGLQFHPHSHLRSRRIKQLPGPSGHLAGPSGAYLLSPSPWREILQLCTHWFSVSWTLQRQTICNISHTRKMGCSFFFLGDPAYRKYPVVFAERLKAITSFLSYKHLPNTFISSTKMLSSCNSGIVLFTHFSDGACA